MAVLKVTISEELVINGNDLGTKNVFTDSSITFADRRVMSLTTASRSIILFNSQNEAGAYQDDVVEYLRITNLDDTIGIVLDIRGSSKQYFVDLEPECSFLLSNNEMDANNETTAQVFSTSNIDSIHAKSKSGTSSIEYFISG
tara:strand:+ start:351 stop:779 length:429 start_codon:yes stop_codon:yes gene_type:complete